LDEPTVRTEGPSAGQTWVYFLAPWGMQLELVSFPNGKAYEKHSAIRLWHPADPAAGSSARRGARRLPQARFALHNARRKPMTCRSNSTAARDIAYHLHAYTNAKKQEAEGSLVLTSGKGIHVYDENGKAYLEGMSGLWCLALGYGEERLIEAANR